MSEGQFRTIGEAVAWYGRELGVEVSYKKLYDWFRRWGYRQKVPQPMAEKTNAQAQKAWKKGYRQPCRRRGYSEGKKWCLQMRCGWGCHDRCGGCGEGEGKSREGA